MFYNSGFTGIAYSSSTPPIYIRSMQSNNTDNVVFKGNKNPDIQADMHRITEEMTLDEAISNMTDGFFGAIVFCQTLKEKYKDNEPEALKILKRFSDKDIYGHELSVSYFSLCKNNLEEMIKLSEELDQDLLDVESIKHTIKFCIMNTTYSKNKAPIEINYN